MYICIVTKIAKRLKPINIIPRSFIFIGLPFNKKLINQIPNSMSIVINKMIKYFIKYSFILFFIFLSNPAQWAVRITFVTRNYFLLNYKPYFLIKEFNFFKKNNFSFI